MNSIIRSILFMNVVMLLFLYLFLHQNSYAANKDANSKTDYEILIEKNDYQGALAIIRPLADKNDIKAMKTLGLMYVSGRGVEENINEGFKWLKKAAEQGDGFSQLMVGVFYKSGELGFSDMNEAFRWFKKSSDNGIASAHNELGRLYYSGVGVSQDYSAALNYFVKAAEGEEIDGFMNIGTMYFKGEGVQRDLVEAIKYMSIAGMTNEEKYVPQIKNVLQYMSKEQIAEAGKKAEALAQEIVECTKKGKPLKLNIAKIRGSSSSSKETKTLGGISCGDPIVKGMVIDRAIRSWGSDMAQMGMSRNQLSVENIRTREETKRFCKCAADVVVNLGFTKKSQSVVYTAEMTDDGNPYVTVYGF